MPGEETQQGTESAPDPSLAPILASRGRLLAFVERRVGSRDLAEEILQGALLRALETSHQVRDESRIQAWFYQILRNAIASHYRRTASRQRALEQWERGAPSAEEETPGEICRCLEDVLPSLEPSYEEILRRVDLEEGDAASFALEAGLDPGNARVRLHRARRALRRELLRVCRSCAEHGCLDCDCRRHRT